MHTQVAIQKLPYSQLINGSKHCAQNQIESHSLQQFAEWLSLTDETFKNLEPLSQIQLSKINSTNPGRHNSHYGHAHSRYAQNHIQGTSRYVSTQSRSSAMQPISSPIENAVEIEDNLKFQKSATTVRRRTERSSNGRGSKCPFEAGDHRIYMREKKNKKNISFRQRKDAIYQLKASFNRLKLGHLSMECQSTESCGNCNKRYQTHLRDESSQSANSAHCSTTASSEHPSFLQILPVTLSRDGKSIKAYAFLDNGSVVSMMLKKFASAIGIVRGEKPKHTQLRNGIHGTKTRTYTNVNLSIKGMNPNQSFDMEDVQVSADIEFPQYNLAWIRKVSQQHEHLKHKTYPDVTATKSLFLLDLTILTSLRIERFTMALQTQ